MSGRPKKGIDYSGWDVDIFENDTKIDELLDAQGWNGFAIYFYLCQRAYASEGYFYRWSYANAATTARRMGGGIGSETVKQTVAACLQIGLFDKRLFDLGSVLTSKGIQRRFAQAIQSRRSKTVNKGIWLLDDNETKGFGIALENSEMLPTNSDVHEANSDLHEADEPKSIVKKSIVKESIGEERRVRSGASPNTDYARLISERAFSSNVTEVLEEFLRYKKTEKRFTYKEIGFRNLLDEFEQNIRQYGEAPVISLVKSTMANGYQGIPWDRLKQYHRNDRISNRVTEVDNW